MTFEQDPKKYEKKSVSAFLKWDHTNLGIEGSYAGLGTRSLGFGNSMEKWQVEHGFSLFFWQFFQSEARCEGAAAKI